MTAFRALVGVTLRGLLGRRRTLLMVLLAGLPVLVGLLIRLGGGRSDAPEILDTLVVRTVLGHQQPSAASLLERMKMIARRRLRHLVEERVSIAKEDSLHCWALR